MRWVPPARVVIEPGVPVANVPSSLIAMTSGFYAGQVLVSDQMRQTRSGLARVASERVCFFMVDTTNGGWPESTTGNKLSPRRDNTAVEEGPAPGPLGVLPPPASQPPSDPPPPKSVVPFDQEAVWALVMGILSWVTCPLVLGVAAFVIGGSARRRIRLSGYTLRGDGLAHAGQALGCLASLFWVVVLLVIFGAFSIGAIGINTFLHPSPSP